MRILMFSFLFLASLFVQPSFGATWYVAKDGSGDFAIIQDAVNAAVDGDVIEIGPGRYDDYTTIGNWDNYVIIPEKSLTIRGAGAGETIIGPDDPEANSNNASGIASLDYPGFLRIENLTIENINRVAVESSALIFEFENCTVVECKKVLQAYDGGGFVKSCSFSENNEGMNLFRLTSEFVVEDCNFENVNTGIFIQGTGTPLTIQNCDLVTENSIWPSHVGIKISGNAICEVSNCRIEGYSGIGVVIGDSAQGFIHDCTITQRGGDGLYLGNFTSVQFHDNILISDSACILIAGRSLDGATSTALHNNHILREGNGLFVKNYTGDHWSHPTEYFDMTLNYWGTQDPDEISPYIEDGYSIPTLDYYINFDPMADGPVSTDRTTLDGLKAIYR